MFLRFVWLALAGAAGTLARYWLLGVIQKNTTTEFPFATATVNIIGCLIFGLIWAFVENRLSINGQMKMVIFCGFFGAFTTFSSFVFETTQLLDGSRWLWASGNILLQNAVGLASVMAGLFVGKLI